MSEFPGDENKMLMDIQHWAYGDMVSHLFTAPRARYLAAATLLGIEDELSTHLRSTPFFDHRTLQLAHDRIAAYFRFSNPDASQIQLGEEESAHKERIGRAWRDFFLAELDRLCEHDEFTRAVCTATVFENKEAGINAEKAIDEFLRDRYAYQGLTAWRDPNWSSIRLPV